MSTTTKTENFDPISTDAAADIIGCSPRHVRKLCETGQLRSKKIGARMWLVSRVDAERKSRNISSVGRPRKG